MKLKYAEQLGLNQIVDEKFDLFICASGYETRATKLATTLKSNGSKKIVIGFTEFVKHPQRIKNDEIFKQMGFEPHMAHEGSCDEIINILNLIFKDFLTQKSVNILVDYSCMTKVWYATIINFFINRDSSISELSLNFSYSPSCYSEPQDPMPNKYMGPIPGIYCVSNANKPTALILGLGYEKERAQGIVEYLDPKVTYAFYTDPAIDMQFVQIVKDNNAQLLDSIGDNNIFTYSFEDLKQTDALLTSLCADLKNKYRLILAPLGPKPFALLCLLLAVRHPEIDVWRVSAGDSGNIYDRPPLEVEPIICKSIFVKETARSMVKTLELA